MSAIARARRRTRPVGDRQLAILMLLPALILLGAFSFYPLILAIRDSFLTVPFGGGGQVFVGLANYQAVLSSPITQASFLRTLEYVAGSLLIQVPAGVVCALVLNQGLRGQSIWRGLVLFPYMVPPIVAAIIFRYAFNGDFGAVNYILLDVLHITRHPVGWLTSPQLVMVTVILVNAWSHTPFMTIVMLARLQSVPRDLKEAAAVDGAGRFGTFRHVVLPWLMPVLLIAMLLRMIWTAVVFDFPYLLAQGGPLYGSTVTAIQIYNLQTQQLNMGEAAALSMVLGLVILLASIFYLRSYRRQEGSMG